MLLLSLLLLKVRTSMLYHKGQNYAVQLDINQASNNNHICSVVGALF